MMKIKSSSHLGGLVVTIYAHRKPKQVRKIIQGISNIKEAVHVAVL